MNDQHTFEHQPIAWTPTAEVIERAQLTRFMKQTGAESFDEVYQKSIKSPEDFTSEVLKFLDIKFDPPYEKLLDISDGIEWSKWCVGGGLNISEMCVNRWARDETIANQAAIIWEGEEGEVKTVTYKELLAQIEYCAAGLRLHGLKKGDAIGIHLPMVVETVFTLLAIARIGAIAVPVFSGYGVDAIASRLNAVGAKAVFSCTGFSRRGKWFDASEIVQKAAKSCPTVKIIYFVDSNNETVSMVSGTNNHFTAYYFGELMWDGENGNDAVVGLVNKVRSREDRQADDSVNYIVPTDESEKTAQNLRYTEPTLAEDPLIILYTSGTTGKPKGIAHTHCGFPVKAAQDMAFGTDVGVGTRISWVTDIGWMMGPWLIYGALINGATICIYDGAPDYPNADRMWEFCAKHKVEILGISPTLVRSLSRNADTLVCNAQHERLSSAREKSTETSDKTNFAVSGDADKSVHAPFQKHDLSSLRAFASTGEPWNPAPWWWLFEKVGDSKLPIINYSGGTEISGGILMGNPLLPIKPCSFPAPCLGIDVGILNDTGRDVEKGTVGELSIKKPWIGMARGFWQEPERYIETYWKRFDKIWVHGDWAMQDEDGHFYILGRSDDTLKVAGKRVGPAEVESLLVAHEAVAEAAVIGVPDEIKGTKMIAFCVLRGADTPVRISAEREKSAEMFEDNDADKSVRVPLETELKSLVAKDMGKPLMPSKIHFVSALPKTRNAKVMRRVIRSAYLGEDAGDLSALENPQTVEEIANIKQ
jgi:acetyl-CoA synthetase